MTLVLCVVFVALVFEYVNGFHDTANAVATSVATKVLTPTQAIILATVFNLVGALIGEAVAKTIGKGLVDANLITLNTILFGLVGAIIWNLITWWFCLPSSSSHALIGGLCGSALASAQNNWSVIYWYNNTVVNPATQEITKLSFVKSQGLWPKVVFPMVAAPLLGLVIGFVLMSLLYFLLHKLRPSRINFWFGKIQLLSATWMSLSHGMNDAQKTMGIIALTLFTASTASEAFAHLPGWLEFLRLTHFDIPLWVKVVCALAMAAGTAAGGKRIIRTLGGQMVKLQPVHGFTAQTTAAAIIESASHFGIPLSTTHVISSAIMGVGASKRLRAVKWTVAERMLWAWVMTLPISGVTSYALMRAGMALGLK
jgi:PiT family inorganic phosphate transporter